MSKVQKLERFEAAVKELQDAVSDLTSDCPHKVEVSSCWTPVYTIGMPTKWLLDVDIEVRYQINPHSGENL